MSLLKSLVKRRPLFSFFAFVFAISWGSLLIIVGGPVAIPAAEEEIGRLMLLVYLLWITGPAVAGILFVSLLQGTAGLRDLGSRLLKWRVGARWYGAALLTAPLLASAVLFGLSLTSPDFLPRIVTADDKGSLLLFSVSAALLVGIFEELGWTGFAVPALRRRYGVLGTGLILGLLLAAWQFLVVFWAVGDSPGDLPLALFLPVTLFTWIPAYRVLMIWVYDRTESLLLAILMHTSLVTFWTMLTPLTITGISLVTYYLLFTAAMWIVIAAVAVANRRRLSPQPPRGRLA